MTLTYFEFHALFVLPPVALLAGALWRRRSGGRPWLWLGVVIVELIALGYTTPWDNFLIAEGAWWYADGAVAGRIWHAPLGEYFFILIQPVMTALWLFNLRTERRSVSPTLRQRAAGLAAGFTISAAGVAMYLADPALLYLGSLIAWGGPVLAIQWGTGWPYLWANRRTFAAAILVPALYLCIVDRIAIDMGIWVLSPELTTGIAVLGLPIEEGAFFLLTCTFVVQGVTLWEWVTDLLIADEPTAATAPETGR